MATVSPESTQTESPDLASTQKALPAPHAPGDGMAPPPTSRAGSVTRKILIITLLVVAAALFVWRLQANRAAQQAEADKMLAAANRPVPVSVVPVQQRTMPIYLNALGTVTAYNTVTVRSRVDGQIIRVNFREGQAVRKGDLLVQIDPRPYQAALEQAEGQLARDQANSKNAEAEAARYTALYNAGVVSRESQQSQVSTAGQASGTLKADQASIDAAKVNLAYTRISSPIDGVVGLRQVDPGNIVQAASTTGLVVVTQIQPISVIFTLPEDNLPEVLGRLRSGHTMTVEAFDRANTTHLASGTLLTVDNQIDTTTGTDKVKAVFSNAEHTLFPNQFVNVRLVLQDRPNSIVIPSATVQTGSQGSYVYLVHDGNPPAELAERQADTNSVSGKGKGKKKAAATDNSQSQQQQQGPPRYVTTQPIKIDLTEGTQVLVSEGLQAGSEIVIDGQEKLKNGSRVVTHAARSTGSTPTSTSVQQNLNTQQTSPQYDVQPAGRPRTGQQDGQPAGRQGQTGSTGGSQR